VEPGRFLMIGNALRSDGLPVIEIGGWAVYVPAELSWAHEHAELPATARERYAELESLAHLGDLIEAFERRLTV
jgi:putative hydrolase of the HAD superfamily